MSQHVECPRAAIADEVAELARRRLDAVRAGLAEPLIRRYLAGMPAADLESARADMLYGAAMSLFGLARDRNPAQARLRVYDPALDADGWVSPHTVIEAINDDMPFLVDSIGAELARSGISIHLLVHPVVRVRRDAAGHLTGVLGPDETGEAAEAESLMHVEIDRQTPEAQAALSARLSGVLADVRAAVTDWQPMRARTRELGAELARLPAGPDRGEVDEARAFLDWLHDQHFTFLGSRRFIFTGAPPAPGIATDEAANLGILAAAGQRVFDDALPLADMPADVRTFLTRPGVLLVTKSACRATVHRAVHMDVIGVKRFESDGRVAGMDVLLGLFTAAAYTSSPAEIPLLRRKVARIQERSGFAPGGHNSKTLANILDTYPRDELFQVSENDLFPTALGILHLQERGRTALFVRRDEFERFVSCLVFVPRDRYDTPLRLAIVAMLEDAFAGTLDAYYTQVGDQPLARLHVVIRTMPGAIPPADLRQLEARVAEAARSWAEQLLAALVQSHGEAEGVALARRYADAFPASYRERHGALVAVADIDRVEAVLDGAQVALNLYRPVEAAEHEARLKVTHRRTAVPLSEIMPMLEAMGLKVIAEVPHELRPAGHSDRVWMYDFSVETADGGPLDVHGRREAFQEALARVWRAEAESDGFNRLVLAAGLDWRQVTVLRAYAKYLRQAGFAYSQSYMERALAENPAAGAALVRLFLARFDPDSRSGDPDAALAEAGAALDRVEGADDDRILRRFLGLIQATLRTNYFQAGQKPYLSLKLDSRAVEDLPQPRPLVEIFVCSPRVEAIHLRGGRVARGGIRWSDRREDFRTEVLGLMKAQMVKNAVIVPVGAKGGFVVKRPPADPGRGALQAEAVECYRTMMRGLLDLTDTLEGSTVVPPPRLVRHDGDDPYLVVAADKGTASFSDVANGVAAEYGFWLGDAFASGGSRGYDHKAMGITARGAWEAIRRHFREMGIDTQTHDFTVIGVGDMSGDVFGNAMLLSRHIRLVGAFNHSHVFLDPDPHAERSFAERQRLFRDARSWPDYDPTLISEGGGVWSRAAKFVPVSPQMRERFGIESKIISPNELIRTLLRTAVDLLFFGGIGTVVKSSRESHAEVGDRATEAIRVDGCDLKARVVGEGANLACTQAGRIEYALVGAEGKGGRINTDAIDNSAGVDTSDHEVNIKILLDDFVAAGDLTAKRRNELLAAMTDEVGSLVLRDNTLQTQAISVLEAQGPDILDAEARFMRLLEKAGRLDRALEGLPSDETLTERAARRKGFVRPELAVLLAYGKIWLNDHILRSDLPDDPFLAMDLARYFPSALRERFEGEIRRHRLRREIVATTVTNSMVNRVGGAFMGELIERTGHPPARIARAYIVARDAFRLREVWRAIEMLDGIVPAAAQTAMLIEANRLMERATLWVVRCVPSPLFDIGAAIADLSPGIRTLEEAVPAILPHELAHAVLHRARHFADQGVPEALAHRVANLIVLASAADIVRIAGRQSLDVEVAGRLYFAVGSRLGLGWLRASAERLAARGHWQKLAASAAIEELYAHQRDITNAVAVAASAGQPAEEAVAAWAEGNRAAIERTDSLLAEIKAAHQIDLAMLTVVNRQLRTLSETATPP